MVKPKDQTSRIKKKVMINMSRESIETVRAYYNEGCEGEWRRINGRPEFLLTCRFLDRYIKPGDKVLDIGGGPGRYSLYLAEKSCKVTLVDLSEENVKFALQKAKEADLKLNGFACNALELDKLISEQYDHVLLMGPLYHLLEEEERITAVNQALNALKPGGKLFVSFISMNAGMVYAMKCAPDVIADPNEKGFYNAFLDGNSFSGEAFTQAYFIAQKEVLPFMAQFPLQKLHFFGQEGMTSPCESNIMSQPKEIIDQWMDFTELTCEREELLSWSEHLMYVGEKL